MIGMNPISLRNDFSREAAHERKMREWLEYQRRQADIKNREKAELAEAEFGSLAQTVIEVTMEEIAAFDAELTKYETLTVEEINRLRERLDELMEERQRLLDNAHVLPDGRRVFKTEDGTKVFDEHGNEVGRDVVDPAEIGDDRPSWETWVSTNNEIAETQKHFDEAQDFQSKLDDLRDRFNKGEISKPELIELRSELEQSIPESFRARELKLELGDAAPTSKPDFAAAVQNKVDVDSLDLGAPSITQ